MTKEKVIEIFSAILSRKPTDEEIERFQTMSEEELILELRDCPEKIINLFHLSGERFKTRVPVKNNDIEKYYSNKKDYKIALCLSGHIRDYQRNLNSINKHLANPLKADVFLHTWDSIGTQKEIVQGTCGPIPDSTDKNLPNLYELIPNLKSVKIESNEIFLEDIDKELEGKKFFLYGMILDKKRGIYGGQAEPKYIYSQFYSVNQSYQLAKQYMNDNSFEYDIVIKLRADYYVHSGITSKEIEDIIKNKNEKRLYVPNVPYSNHGHPMCKLCMKNVEHEIHSSDVCDVFAYGSLSNMDKYFNMYEELDNLRIKQNEDNQRMLRMKNDFLVEKKGNLFSLVDIWKYKERNMRLNCFYPERLYRDWFKGHRLVSSKLNGEVLRKSKKE